MAIGSVFAALGRATAFTVRWIVVAPVALGTAYVVYEAARTAAPAAGRAVVAVDVAASAICAFCTCAAAAIVAPALKRWTAAAFGVVFVLDASFLVVAGIVYSRNGAWANAAENLFMAAALCAGALAGVAVSGSAGGSVVSPRLPALLAWPLVVLTVPLALFVAGVAGEFSMRTTDDAWTMAVSALIFLASLATVSTATALAPKGRLVVALLVGSILMLPGMLDLVGGAARPLIAHAVESAGRDYHPYARYASVQALFGAAAALAGLFPAIAVIRLRGAEAH